MSDDEKKPDAMIVRPKDARAHLRDLAHELYDRGVEHYNEGIRYSMASARLVQAADIFSDAGCESFLAKVLTEGTYLGGLPISAPGGDA